ncbi:DNA recombination and repair protein [Tetragenococcus muriaticus 3MR10-3]|uniref:DNA recombination and repair protein n=1 Tax=Tetragenococcus muriaticus 3MR10-3 TaxID=1302648 RepID=A0A091BXY9_9ENTE|nr:DNA recombination and repair protein [Tetragenococcus muriaticus 3MR10-3]
MRVCRFLNSAKYIYPFTHIQEDIFAAGYATYIMNLADAAIEDKVYDPHLYTFLYQALEMLDQGIEGQILTNIFEVQILQRFGITINWRECAVCGRTQGKFDFSSKYNGILCQQHWDRDFHRYHADPRAVHFIRLFSHISYDKIHSIELKEETKSAIRQTIDQLYEEYVGLNLKSKKFIDQMHRWGDVLKSK